MLKKSAIFAAIILASTTAAHADLLDISAGIKVWNNNMKFKDWHIRGLEYIDDDYKLKPVIWAKIEHDVPVLPNFKLRYTNLEHNKSKRTTDDFRISDKNYDPHSNIKLDVNLSHFDITPYYNIVNNDAMSLGFGLNLKVGDFKVKATDGTTPSELDLSGILPLLYACTEINLPYDISIKADGAAMSLASSNDYTMYDTQISLAWKMFETNDVEASIEGGYRKIFARYSKDSEEHCGKELQLEQRSSGFFAGVSVNY
jgi:outer membrane protein